MIAIDRLKFSSVDKEILKKEFIDYIPRRLEDAMDTTDVDWREDREEWRKATYFDYIDYHYRRYLKGQAKTLKRIFSEFKQLPKHYFMEAISLISDIAGLAEMNEFYELLERHYQAKQKIIRLGLKLYGKTNSKDTAVE